jgi:UDP-N-acetylglucosamine 3-dehydrogenase
MSALLRMGLVGIGMMGRNHARVLHALEGVELVAIADPAGDKHDMAGSALVVDSVGALIEQRIDAAVVAVPTRYHLDAGLQLAAAGVHTLIEKPLATDGSEAQQLVKAFEGAGLVNAVGHIERYNPALRALRFRLENGELGEIYQVATRRQGPFPNRIADVGVVKDLATHDIDLTAWVIQSPYAQVSAQTAHKSGREHEDLISITAQMQDGTVVSHLVNWLSPLKERITIVTGERGAFVADTLQGDLTFHENGLVATEWDQVATFRGVTEGNSIRFAIAKPEPLRVQHENFRDAVLGSSSDIVTMREGLATVAVADACIQSSREGRTIDVQY